MRQWTESSLSYKKLLGRWRVAQGLCSQCTFRAIVNRAFEDLISQVETRKDGARRQAS